MRASFPGKIGALPGGQPLQAGNPVQSEPWQLLLSGSLCPLILRDASMANSGQDDWPTCFVAMPVSTPDHYAERLRDPHHFPHVLEHLFRPALTKAGYRGIAPTSRGAQLIHAEVIKNLEQSDLVLCDLSGLNANVFFELGIRTSLDRPLALVKDKITERIPFDLNAINTYSYDESLASWTLDNEIDQLAEHIRAIDTSPGSGNDMWHYFGLTKRAAPADITENPTEAKLDLLLAEVTALRGRGTRASSSLSGMRSDLSSVSADDAGVIVRDWFAETLFSFIGRRPEFSVHYVKGEFHINLKDEIAASDRVSIEKAAQEQLGVKITIHFV